jgi:hypothetical protein
MGFKQATHSACGWRRLAMTDAAATARLAAQEPSRRSSPARSDFRRATLPGGNQSYRRDERGLRECHRPVRERMPLGDGPHPSACRSGESRAIRRLQEARIDDSNARSSSVFSFPFFSRKCSRRSHNPKVVGSSPTPATKYLNSREISPGFSISGLAGGI